MVEKKENGSRRISTGRKRTAKKARVAIKAQKNKNEDDTEKAQGKSFLTGAVTKAAPAMMPATTQRSVLSEDTDIFVCAHYLIREAVQLQMLTIDLCSPLFTSGQGWHGC